MALSDKNLIITPNIGSSNEPKIDFVGASTNTGPSTITATVYPTNNGTLSFDGTAGNLFSITNNLASGSIFSVNPISGIPIIDVNADRTIALNPYGGNTGIGLTNPTSKLQVTGNVLISGVTTSSSGFVGNLSGNINSTGVSTFTNGPVLIGSGTSTGTASQRLQVTGGAYVSGSVGIGTTNPIQPVQIGTGSTVVVIDSLGEVGIGTTNPTSKLHVVGTGLFTGIVTASSFSGTATSATTSINVIGGIGSLSSLTVSGISTFTNDPVLIGSGTSTGTASQRLQVTGGAYVSGSVGIGTTNPSSTLHLVGDLNIDGGGNFTTLLQTIPATEDKTISFPNSSGTLALVAGNNSQITYNLNGENAGSSGLTYNTNAQSLSVGGASTTTNTPVLNIIQTWNSVSTGFTGVQLNIIDTASSSQSLLQDWQINYFSRFQFSKTGIIYSYNYNVFVTSASYERAKFGWESNILRIGTEKVGTSSTARGLELQTDGVTRVAITTTGLIGIGTTNPTQRLDVNGNVIISGVTTSSSGFSGNISGNVNSTGVSTFTDIRLNSVSEKSTIISGNTVNLVYNTGGGNVAICTNPTGPITLNVTGIPTDTSFDNRTLTFTVVAIQTSIGYACTTVNLNGVARTVRYPGGVISVGSTSSYDIFNFTGINTVGSGSTTANYQVLGLVNGNFK